MTELMKPDEMLRRLAGDAQMAVIYDGQCVFCSAYVQLLRLREAVGKVQLVDARSEGIADLIDRQLGLDLNKGMLVIYHGRYYYGADAMTLLSVLTSPSGVLNRTIALAFRSNVLSRMLYPFLRLGRRTALLMLGRSTIQLRRSHQHQ